MQTAIIANFANWGITTTQIPIFLLQMHVLLADAISTEPSSDKTSIVKRTAQTHLQLDSATANQGRKA
jgi:hypothetical protein